MKIIADTAALISPCDGEIFGITVIPVCVTINDKTYRDYTDISTLQLLERIDQGGIPTSSQPAVGDILDVLDVTDDELLFLTVGDGLSGAYQTAVGARSLAANPERIHIMDSQTLGGPLHYLVKKAVMLNEQGLPIQTIKEQLQNCIASSVSFVIPEDFEFLKRSGRLTPLTAKVGGALRLLPVLTQTKDRKRIAPAGIKRSLTAAVETVLQKFHAMHIGTEHLISICHAGTQQKAEQVLQQIHKQFPETETEILELSPALTTHGGPGCIVIQAILK